LKNVFRKRTRTALTVASIVLPLLLICTMATFLAALDRPDPAATRGMYRLVTRHQVSLATPLPESYLAKVAALPGVAAATSWTFFGGRYREARTQNMLHAIAVEPESFLPVYDDARLVSGSIDAWKRDRTGCLVGRNLASRFGWTVGSRIPLIGNAMPFNPVLTVDGIYEIPEGPSAAIFFQRKYLEESWPAVRGQMGSIWVKAKDAAAADRLPAQIDALFANSPWPTKTESEKAFQMGFVSMLGNVKLLITSIGAIITVVILLVAGNTMAMAARERTTEIAVLRTLGFSPAGILGLVLGESAAIALSGGVLGLVLFAAMEPSVKRQLMGSPMAMLAASMKVEPRVLFLGFGISVLVGLLAGIVPAVKAARRPIAQGLRQVV
jgi:putative ABC transport system permease protein